MRANKFVSLFMAAATLVGGARPAFSQPSAAPQQASAPKTWVVPGPGMKPLRGYYPNAQFWPEKMSPVPTNLAGLQPGKQMALLWPGTMLQYPACPGNIVPQVIIDAVDKTVSPPAHVVHVKCPGETAVDAYAVTLDRPIFTTIPADIPTQLTNGAKYALFSNFTPYMTTGVTPPTTTGGASPVQLNEGDTHTFLSLGAPLSVPYCGAPALAPASGSTPAHLGVALAWPIVKEVNPNSKTIRVSCLGEVGGSDYHSPVTGGESVLMQREDPRTGSDRQYAYIIRFNRAWEASNPVTTDPTVPDRPLNSGSVTQQTAPMQGEADAAAARRRKEEADAEARRRADAALLLGIGLGRLTLKK